MLKNGGLLKVTGRWATIQTTVAYMYSQCDIPPRDSSILFQHRVLFNISNVLRVMSDAIFEASLL